MTPTIRLGFEVGTGTPVDVPLRHLVTGQTQESGTTTLEALIRAADILSYEPWREAIGAREALSIPFGRDA